MNDHALPSNNTANATDIGLRRVTTIDLCNSKMIALFMGLCILGISLLVHAPAINAAPILLSPERLSGTYIGKDMEYLIDAEKKITIDTVTSAAVSRRFQQSDADILNLGYLFKDVWIRFTVDNPSRICTPWYLELSHPFMHTIDLYVPAGDGTYISKKLSKGHLVETRDINYLNFLFSIDQKPGSATYYMHLFHAGECMVPLKIWSHRALLENISGLYVFLSLFYGILCVMFIYNLFLFISIRERSYFYYLLTIVSFIVLYLCMDGSGYAYVWHHMPLKFQDIIMPLSISLTHGAGLLFMREYLQTRKTTPRLDIAIRIFLVLELLIMIGTFVNNDITLLAGLLMGIVEMLFVICIVSPVHLYLKSRPARYYSVAYIALLFGFILRSLSGMGLLPLNMLTTWGPQIGTICMTILFSLGLADKINTMKNELADMNENLERKVQERTVELQAAMEELESMNENLKDAMDELAVTNDELVKARDALWGEMQLAKKIQTVLLPAQPNIPGYAIAAYMNPADEVGGDYYDIINANGRDWIVIGDVSGHGVTAGLIMMMAQTAINAVLVRYSDLPPTQLLSIINSVIRENIKKLEENKYMTITVFACIENGVFHFAGLHQDIMVYRKHQAAVELVETDGMWIGLFDRIDDMLKDNTLQLDHEDVMLLYTDGITEARHRNDDSMYSNETLALVLKENGGLSPFEIQEKIISSLSDYRCTDDVTMVIFKRI